MICQLENISKKFSDHVVINNLNFDFKEGMITIINGESGCGKSTLLNIIGLLDSPTSGTVNLFAYHDIKINSFKAKKLLKNKIGYLFQNFALVDDRSVYYNLMIAIEGHKITNKKQVIAKALKTVGLSNYESKLVSECSGGEQQRVSLARLLIKPCELILADEPTGSLDDKNKHIIMDLLLLLKKSGKTIILVTHDDEMKTIADEVLELTKL